MFDDDEEIKEEGFKIAEDELDVPPEEIGLGDDFGLEDPDDKYH